MGFTHGFFSSSLASAAAALALCACNSTSVGPRTEVLVTIDADPGVRAAAETLKVEITTGPKGSKKLGTASTESFDLQAKSFQWPASIALVPRSGHEAYVFEVVVTPMARGEVLARTRVRSEFLSDKTLVLQMKIADVCLAYLGCSVTETCAPDAAHNGAAVCRDAHLNASLLPLFDPNKLPKPSSNDAAISGGDAALGADASRADASSADASSDAAKPDAASGSDACAGAKENCDNGIDDDCNGLADCADPACTSIEVCVPQGSELGVLVGPAANCPAGFAASERVLYQGLTDTGCSGCSCSATTSCAADLHLYPTGADCMNTTLPDNSAATLVTSVTSTTCNQNAVITGGNVYGWSVASMRKTNSCTASGTGSLRAPSWSTARKLCTTAAVSGKRGCSTGELCVHKPQPASTVCSATTNCSKPSATQTWFSAHSDGRSCGVCGCQASGGDCSNVSVVLGNDYSCGASGSMLKQNQKLCASGTATIGYAPPAYLDTAAVTGTCSASAPTTGALTPTGRVDLCCSP